ncbi:MAG: ribosome-associated translation inhibitor RaiA [Acidobacteriota bacterium]|nr:ribosome-associated translation inhibitor RaiA [Acidobacteriota bacterium]
MKVTYTGRHVDLAPAQVQKIEEQFIKVGKLLDGKGRDGVSAQEAHVRVGMERHLHCVEVNVNFHHHTLVGHAQDADLFTAIHGAVHKLETQAIKVTEKWNDGKRVSKPGVFPVQE